jgi:hypothetical protein
VSARTISPLNLPSIATATTMRRRVSLVDEAAGVLAKPRCNE